MPEKPSAKNMIRPDKPEHWEPYREVITALYSENTLSAVIEQMKIVHFFSATPKQYKTKIKDWGLTTKYVKDFEYEELLNQEEQDEYNVRGKRVSHQDVARFKRRKEKIENKSDSKSSKSKGSSSGSKSKSGGNSSSGGGDGVEFYDANTGADSGDGYIMSSDQYVDYSAAGDSAGYVTSGGPADYSGYVYDHSGVGSEVYDTQHEHGGYEQQGSYQQHQSTYGSGDATGWGY